MNMQQIVQQMTKMQRLYEKEHKQIEDKEYEFVANGVVKVVLKGNYELVSIEFIDKDAVKEDPEMVEDMIKIAYNGCKEQIESDEQTLADKFKKTAGGGMMF